LNGGKGLLLTVAIYLCCKPASVNAVVDGEKLLQWCENLVSTNGDPYLSGLCVGFLAGSFQTPDMRANITAELLENQKTKEGLGYYHGLTQTLYCIPKEATAQTIAQVVTKHIRENPVSMKQPASAALVISVSLTYPCTKTVNEQAVDLEAKTNENSDKTSRAQTEGLEQ